MSGDAEIVTLNDLEQTLRSLSHGQDALNAVREFSAQLKRTEKRINTFNANRAIVCPPISPEDTRALGYKEEEDDFRVLQGDIVATESAYFLGERVTNWPKYAILNPSCDLVPERREFAALLRIGEIRRHDPEAKSNTEPSPPIQEDRFNVLTGFAHGP